MKIKGWTVREGYSREMYFSGMNAENKPIFELLCYRTRAYKTERAAASAIRIITDSGYEGSPESCYVDTEAEDKPVPVLQESADVPSEEAAAPQKASPDSPYEQIVSDVLKPPGGWRILDHFGKSLALLYNGEHFAIRNKDTSRLFEDGRSAAQEWCSLRSEIFMARIEKLGGAS